MQPVIHISFESESPVHLGDDSGLSHRPEKTLNTASILAPIRGSDGRFTSTNLSDTDDRPTTGPIARSTDSESDFEDLTPLNSPPQPLTPKTHQRPMATQQPLTRFCGDPDDPIQPATFLQDFEVRMTELMTPRADLASRIKPYLKRDSRAWEWYMEDLAATDPTGSWEGFETRSSVRPGSK
ncbi:hypothetical protein C8J55DRAFT_556344 [Lentinula edodes]|uniref:Uncharacterized protein n=1 Tax=Lentinula lateritia TaxID=40482 RepID=A0A9W9DZ28_9AGAR|nr:hypothetical protein C8J55DRAFT_556344 [Lentinula edodes]